MWAEIQWSVKSLSLSDLIPGKQDDEIFKTIMIIIIFIRCNTRNAGYCGERKYTVYRIRSNVNTFPSLNRKLWRKITENLWILKERRKTHNHKRGNWYKLKATLIKLKDYCITKRKLSSLPAVPRSLTHSLLRGFQRLQYIDYNADCTCLGPSLYRRRVDMQWWRGGEKGRGKGKRNRQCKYAYYMCKERGNV